MKSTLTIITSFLAKHLLVIHKGTLFAKIKSTVSIALSVSPFAYVIEKITNWTLENESYVLFVFGAIAVDHVLGTLIHIFRPTWSWKKNIFGLMTKIGLVVAMGFLFEGINAIVTDDSFVKSYVVIVLRLVVFLYPAGSAFMNSSTITKGKFPPIGLINKIKNFNNNLDLKELKGEKKEIENIEVVDVQNLER